MLVTRASKKPRSSMREKLRNATGSTMVTVLIVMLILTLGGLALATIVLNTASTVTGVRDRSAAQAEIDGVIATQSVALQEGRLKCDTEEVQTGTLRNWTGSGASGITPTDVTWTLECVEEDLNGNATITAYADVDGQEALREAVFSYELTPGEVPVYGGPSDPIMMFGDDGTTFNSNNVVFDPDNPVNVSIPRGGFTCNTRIPGDLTVYGSIVVQGGCQVTGHMISVTGKITGPGLKVGGDVLAYGDVHMNGNAYIEGDLFSHTGTIKMVGSDRIIGNVSAGGTGESSLGHIEGAVHLAGGFTSNTSGFVIGGDVIAAGEPKLRDGKFEGTVTIPTSVPDKKVDVGWSATIQGERAKLNPLSRGFFRPATVTAPVLPDMPEMPTWFEYKYVESDWDAYKTIELGTAGSGPATCQGFKTSQGTWLTDESKNTEQPLVIDARKCGELSTNYGSGANMKLTRNVVLLANQFDFTNAKASAAAGATERPQLWILKSDENASDGVPSCSPQGFTRLNQSTFDDTVTTMLYSPCAVQLRGASTLHGQLYGGSWDGGGGAGLTFSPSEIGLPGMDGGTPPGGGGSSSGNLVLDDSFRLQLSRDLPLE